MEEYVVKFWIKNDEGFMEQRCESVFTNSKNSHKKAEKAIINKYRKHPYNQDITIVSVVYQ